MRGLEDLFSVQDELEMRQLSETCSPAQLAALLATQNLPMRQQKQPYPSPTHCSCCLWAGEVSTGLTYANLSTWVKSFSF